MSTAATTGAERRGDSAADGATRPAIRMRGVGKLYHPPSGRPSTLKESFIGALLGAAASASTVAALAGVDLEIAKGESVGIVGANGSGKSTLLKIVAGVTQPSEGSVEIDGKVLGIIELGAGFHPELSGEDNVRLQGAIYGLSAPEVEQRIEPIFDYAELHDFRATALKHYSSGMVVRLGFAIAISCDPDILVVDEALSVGDQSFQEKCLQTIGELHRSGTTIALVTHQMEYAERVCQRIVWLAGGRVRRSGPATEVLEAYHREMLEGQYGVSEGSLTAERIMVGLPGRFGSGEAKIERVRTLDRSGKSRRNFAPGEPIVFEIDYTADDSVEAVDCSITLDFEDGTSVAFWRAEPEGGLQRPSGGGGCFRLELTAPPLSPGRYTHTLAISRPGGSDDHGEHYDLHFRLHHLTIASDDENAGGVPVELPAEVRWVTGG